MLDSEQDLFWRYNVPMNIICKFNIDSKCQVCSGDEDLKSWLSRFLIAEVPTDVLQRVIKDKYNVIVDSQTLRKHRNHIMVEYFTDEEIKKKAIEDLVAIESDLPTVVDEKKAMDSSIRMLYAKILLMQKEGNTGKEFLMAVHELKSLIEMKLKLKKDLPDDIDSINLKDLIKIELHDRQEDGSPKEADKQ